MWVLDKKAILSDKTVGKKEREKALEVLRKGPAKLALLKHPSVLSVTMPMDESKDIIAFATERIFASLSNVLGDTRNIDHVRVSTTISRCKCRNLNVCWWSEQYRRQELACCFL